jgi:hypothetical protein
MARAAQSTFKDSIILKGGLLLTLVYTKSSRYTGDAVDPAKGKTTTRRIE